MKRLLFLALLALPLIACNSCAPQQAPVPPVWIADAAPLQALDGGPDACGDAEASALALGCPLTTTRAGTSWATVCRNAVLQGVDMRASCIAGAADCATIAACVSSSP